MTQEDITASLEKFVFNVFIKEELLKFFRGEK